MKVYDHSKKEVSSLSVFFFFFGLMVLSSKISYSYRSDALVPQGTADAEKGHW